MLWWSIHTIVNHSAIKERKSWVHATTWRKTPLCVFLTFTSKLFYWREHQYHEKVQCLEWVDFFLQKQWMARTLILSSFACSKIHSWLWMVVTSRTSRAHDNDQEKHFQGTLKEANHTLERLQTGEDTLARHNYAGFAWVNSQEMGQSSLGTCPFLDPGVLAQIRV